MTSSEQPPTVDAQASRLLAALEEKELEIERARAQLREFERRVGAGGGMQVQIADLVARERSRSESIGTLREEVASLRAHAHETTEHVRQLAVRIDALGSGTADAIRALSQEALQSGPSSDQLHERRNRQFVVAAGVVICLLIVWLLERL